MDTLCVAADVPPLITVVRYAVDNIIRVVIIHVIYLRRVVMGSYSLQVTYNTLLL